MSRNVVILLILLLLPCISAQAQSDISPGSRWFDQPVYNPASIARPGYVYLFSDVSQQWTGVNGAPGVLNIQASEYIESLHAAFGLALLADRIGVTQSFNPMINYAYRLANDRDWSLSLGLSAGIFSRSVNGSLFEEELSGDPSIDYDVVREIRPDANAGLEFQTPHFVIGLSSTHLLSIVNADSGFLNTNHRYASLVYKNSDSPLISYFVGLQLVNRRNLTVLEGNACVRFKRPSGLISGPKELFDIGFAYRSSRQMTILFGVFISPDFRLGYAYNQSFISGYYPNGSHEVIVSYRIRRDR